jgi:organic radical activating enzyme
MRRLAFGYSTRCNIQCAHCVATEDVPDKRTMALEEAQKIIIKLAHAGVRAISFTAGEPFLYFDEIVALVKLCARLGILTRVVTNSFWAKTATSADSHVSKLKKNGLNHLRLSYSRWHQENINPRNVLNAARSCQKNGLSYFISFITDFSKEDDSYEQYLRDHNLKFFPEAIIYAGRAGGIERRSILTDFQVNSCKMNPYLSPNLSMYACCDAGIYFSKTNFF